MDKYVCVFYFLVNCHNYMIVTVTLYHLMYAWVWWSTCWCRPHCLNLGLGAASWHCVEIYHKSVIAINAISRISTARHAHKCTLTRYATTTKTLQPPVMLCDAHPNAGSCHSVVSLMMIIVEYILVGTWFSWPKLLYIPSWFCLLQLLCCSLCLYSFVVADLALVTAHSVAIADLVLVTAHSVAMADII